MKADEEKRQYRQKGRRRVRKLVEKTIKDEDGFMVTKKEYESASETDDETEETKPVSSVLSMSKANVQKKKSEAVVQSPEKKKAKVVKQNKDKKQQSIMSFFKKK